MSKSLFHADTICLNANLEAALNVKRVCKLHYYPSVSLLQS